ncbi:MAG: hypothetical protein ACUVTP_07230 [Candidatus Fervidibacter sp.]|uniref:hypothetical protein n=1 Tax=Candidatus Fervidibacter sp. TaxID=3100871 RepID=UPI00404B2BA9
MLLNLGTTLSPARSETVWTDDIIEDLNYRFPHLRPFPLTLLRRCHNSVAAGLRQYLSVRRIYCFVKQLPNQLLPSLTVSLLSELDNCSCE